MKNTYIAILDLFHNGKLWGSGLTRRLSEEEAAPLLAKGRIKIYDAAPRKSVEIKKADGETVNMTWSEYLKSKREKRNDGCRKNTFEVKI